MEEHEDEMPSAKKQRLAEEVVQQKELLQQEKVFLSYTFTLSCEFGSLQDSERELDIAVEKKRLMLFSVGIDGLYKIHECWPCQALHLEKVFFAIKLCFAVLLTATVLV